MKTIPVNDTLHNHTLTFARKKDWTPPLSLRDDFLFIKTHSEILCLKKKEILYLKASGNYTEIRMANDKKIIASKTLKYFQKFLTKDFLRPHQSYLVNTHFLSSLSFSGNPEIILECGMAVPISRSKQAHIISLFQN